MTVSASASGNSASGTNIAALSSGSVAPWRPPARAPMTEHRNRHVAARSAARGFTWLTRVSVRCRSSRRAAPEWSSAATMSALAICR